MTTPAGTAVSPLWRTALASYVFLLACLLGLYWDTAQSIATIWMRSDAFTHGFIVAPIVVWLVWRRRELLCQINPSPSAWAWPLLAGVAFAWLLGNLAAVNALMQLSFVALVVLLVPAVLGWSVAKAIAFPLAFLFFSVPIGEFAMPQLMEWTADFTVLALRLTGIPVYREGLQFVIPSGNWSVVEACSGVRYLIASLTVGTLFAYLNYQTTSRRVMFIAVSFMVPILANWLRAYLIVLLGHLSDNKLAAGVDHLIYGWVFFGVVIMLMFWVGARWSEPEPDLAAPVSVRATAPVAMHWWIVSVLGLVLLLASPVVARWAIQSTGHATATPVLAAPASLGAGWSLAEQQLPIWQPAYQNPSAQVQAHYANGAQAVGMYLAYYHRQEGDRKLVTSENALVKSKDVQWAQVGRAARTLDIAGKPVAFRTAELRGAPVVGKGEDPRLTVWQIYWVNGSLTSSDMLAKAYAAGYSLLGRGDDSAVIILYAPKGEAGQGALALESFVRDNLSALDALLRAANVQKNQ